MSGLNPRYDKLYIPNELKAFVSPKPESPSESVKKDASIDRKKVSIQHIHSGVFERYGATISLPTKHGEVKQVLICAITRQPIIYRGREQSLLIGERIWKRDNILYFFSSEAFEKVPQEEWDNGKELQMDVKEKADGIMFYRCLVEQHRERSVFEYCDASTLRIKKTARPMLVQISEVTRNRITEVDYYPPLIVGSMKYGDVLGYWNEFGSILGM